MIEPPRMDLFRIAPEAYRHLNEVERMTSGKLDSNLLHLVKMRASQINGCAFCLALHTDEALRHGERPDRLTSLDAWRDSPLYTESECAALQWVEELTSIAEAGASREAFDALKPHFSEEEIGWLTLAGVMINAWNRLAIASRLQYDREQFKQLISREPMRAPAETS